MTDYQKLGYNKIFVSVDGSKEQSKVLDRAIALATINNAELYIGHVVDSTAFETAGTYPSDVLIELEASFRQNIAAQIERAKAEPQIKKIEILVKAGRIRETLKEEMIDVIEPDLIICGARGLSSISYALLGSISTFLVRNAKCDTLVIK